MDCELCPIDSIAIGRPEHRTFRGSSHTRLHEMEDALYLHPAVRECVVMPIPDPPTDDDLFVFVTLQAALIGGEQELRDWVRHKVEDYKTPDRIVVLSQLPKEATGEVDLPALRDLVLSFEVGLDVVDS